MGHGQHLTEAETGRADFAAINGHADMGVDRSPVLIDGLGHMAQHRRRVVDLALNLQRAPAARFGDDAEPLASTLVAVAIGLAAGGEDPAADL